MYMCMYAYINCVPLSIFHCSVGTGSWGVEGVEMVDMSVVGEETTIRCRSNHLTSFAVLVIVSDGTIDDQVANRHILQLLIGECHLSWLCIVHHSLSCHST